ncbi:MAG: S8 family serine peptidase [Burkholderiaceae bacterium]
MRPANFLSCRRIGLCGIAISVFLAGCGGGGDGTADNASLPQTSSDPAVTPVSAPLAPDPYLSLQWHLGNTGQLGGLAGQDLRLGGLSQDGQGVRVAVVDSAIQIRHPDLVARFVPDASFSYRTGQNDPSPPTGSISAPFSPEPGGLDDAHGTAVAGIIGATANNGFGGRGVAPGADLLGFDPITRPTTSNLIDAIARAIQSEAAVINNSWGPVGPESGGSGSFTRAPNAWKQAVQLATEQGRNGLGSLVVFAAGNSGLFSDSSNYDEFTNDPHVIAVASVDDRGRPTGFSEAGANVLVAGFSGDSILVPRGPRRPAEQVRISAGIFTTDLQGARGYDTSEDPDQDFTQFFEGTSAAAPMVSGVAALMLQANPALTWRDLRWLMARTARPSATPPSPGPLTSSVMNAHGFDPKVGFGIIDAGRAVSEATRFTGLGPEKRCTTGRFQVPEADQVIPDNNQQGVRWTAQINPGRCTIERLETVSLTLAVQHAYSADLDIRLISPSGNEAWLSRPRNCTNDECESIEDGFRFGIVRFMGEAAVGAWQIEIRDLVPPDQGRLLWLELDLRGS